MHSFNCCISHVLIFKQEKRTWWDHNPNNKDGVVTQLPIALISDKKLISIPNSPLLPAEDEFTCFCQSPASNLKGTAVPCWNPHRQTKYLHKVQKNRKGAGLVTGSERLLLPSQVVCGRVGLSPQFICVTSCWNYFPSKYSFICSWPQTRVFFIF